MPSLSLCVGEEWRAQLKSKNSLRAKASRVTKRWFTWTFSGFCFFFLFLCLTRGIFSSRGNWYSDRPVRISMAFTNAIQLFSFWMLSCLAEQKLCFCSAVIAIMSLFCWDTNNIVLLFLLHGTLSLIFCGFWFQWAPHEEATVIFWITLYCPIHKIMIAFPDVCSFSESVEWGKNILKIIIVSKLHLLRIEFLYLL